MYGKCLTGWLNSGVKLLLFCKEHPECLLSCLLNSLGISSYKFPEQVVSQMCNQNHNTKNYTVQSLDLRTKRKVTDAVFLVFAAG